MSKTPREIVVSNGHVLVDLDNKMRIRDFFYPNVGLENHIDGHSFKWGIWTDNRFSWIDKNWDIKMKFLPETLVSMCIANNEGAGEAISVAPLAWSHTEFVIAVCEYIEKQKEI